MDRDALTMILQSSRGAILTVLFCFLTVLPILIIFDTIIAVCEINKSVTHIISNNTKMGTVKKQSQNEPHINQQSQQQREREIYESERERYIYIYGL